MKRIFLFVFVLLPLVLRFSLTTLPGYEIGITNLSIALSVCLIIALGLLAVKKFQIDLRKEFSIFKKFDTGHKDHWKGAMIFFGAPVFSIIVMSFILVPLFSITIMRVNSIVKTPIDSSEVVINEVYRTEGKNKKHYVDILHNSEKKTLRINSELSEKLQKTNQVKGIYKGCLGYFAIK